MEKKKYRRELILNGRRNGKRKALLGFDTFNLPLAVIFFGVDNDGDDVFMSDCNRASVTGNPDSSVAANLAGIRKVFYRLRNRFGFHLNLTALALKPRHKLISFLRHHLLDGLQTFKEAPLKPEHTRPQWREGYTDTVR